MSGKVLLVRPPESDRIRAVAGLPALQCGQPGQVRKEAATAAFCKCRGFGSPPSQFKDPGRTLLWCGFCMAPEDYGFR